LSFQIVAAILLMSGFRCHYIVGRGSCIGNAEVFCEMLGSHAGTHLPS